MLFLTYLFPPIANSGTRRSLEFANRLPALGWTPLIIAGMPDRDDRDDALLAEVRDGTVVSRVPLAADVVGRHLGRLLGSQRLGYGVAWRLRALWTRPDYCASWQRGAVASAIKLFHSQGFDAIYASGWPWTSFLVAERVSLLTQKPFILDYRDLWHGSGAEFDRRPGFRRPRSGHIAVEARLLKRANAIVTTTDSFARMLSERCDGRSVHAITNGFAREDFAGFGPPAELTGARPVHISYTGIWRRGYGPDDLYAAIRLLKDRRPFLPAEVRVTMAGFSPGRAREHGVSDIVTELGRVSHGRALEIMKSSDALYLPVSGGVYEIAHLPGKTFEYVGSGRRIIASAENNSEVRRLLEAVGHYAAVRPRDVEGLAGLLERLILRQHDADYGPRDEQAVQRYERSSQAAALGRVLDACVTAALRQ